MKTTAPILALGLALLLASATLSWGEEPQSAAAVISPEDVRSLNLEAGAARPAEAEAPGQYSVDHAAHAVAYNLQAPGIAVIPLPDGRNRVWLSWYEQSNNPGGGAIGHGSTPHAVYAYSDAPFATADPVWHRVLYVDPVTKLGDETVSDPEVARLPDGRLVGSYITSGPSPTRKRSTYAFVIGNPEATKGEFALGRQNWLHYGVLSQPFCAEGKVLAVVDEWNTARRFCELRFPDSFERDAPVATLISEIPWPGPKALTIFFEGSVHEVSGGRYRAYRRTTEGVYTSLSEPGGHSWKAEEKWPDYPTINSRSAFARSPFSGRVLGAVNSPPLGTASRTDLTLVLSEAEGAPGSFHRALNIEPAGALKKITAQYPRLAFDRAGYVYCVYRWADSRAGAPNGGAAITVARVREDSLAGGTATVTDVEKRVARVAAPRP